MDLFVIMTLMLVMMNPVESHSDMQVQEPSGYVSQGSSFFLMQHVFKLEGKVETKIKHIEEDIEDLKSKAINSPRECNNVREDIEEMKSEIENLSEELESAKSEFRDSNSALKQEMAVLQERNSDLQRAVSGLQSSGTTSLCPKGWVRFGESCYKIKEEKMNWESARLKCQDEGGYLAEIDSRAEDQFLKKEAMLIGDSLWLGGSDILREGDWQWITSTKNISGVSFTDWYPGEPSDTKGEENCLHLYKSFNYGWNDASCVHHHGYICERQHSLK